MATQYLYQPAPRGQRARGPIRKNPNFGKPASEVKENKPQNKSFEDRNRNNQNRNNQNNKKPYQNNNKKPNNRFNKPKGKPNNKPKGPYKTKLDLKALHEEYTKLLTQAELLCKNANPEYYSERDINRSKEFENMEIFNMSQVKKVTHTRKTVDGKTIDNIKWGGEVFKTNGDEKIKLSIDKTFDKPFSFPVYILRRLQTATTNKSERIAEAIVNHLDPILRKIM